MQKLHAYNGLTWIDLESPTREEVRSLMETYGIHPLAAEELILPTTKPRSQKYGDFMYATLHFPAWRHSHKETMQEVDFIIGEKLLITTRYESIDAIHKFAKTFEVNSTLEKSFGRMEHAGIIFYHLIMELYHSLSDELDSVSDSLKDVEEKVFEGHEREMVFKLSNLSRELLSFKHTTVLHKDILTSIETFTLSLFGDTFKIYTRTIDAEYEKVNKTIAGYMESLVELRETNNSLLETKQNKIIQTLTVITFITSTLAIFTALLQIDTITRPIVGTPGDFWIIVGIFAVVAGVMLAIFKWKRWL